MWIPVILHINNKPTLFKINKNDTIKGLKKQIRNSFNIYDRDFDLSANKNFLNIEDSIADCNIVANTTIFVIYDIVYGAYIFLNLNNKIERVNVLFDEEKKEITTKIRDIKNYAEILMKCKVNLYIYQNKEKIKLSDLNLSLNQIGIKNSDKPLISNMIFIEN